MRKRYAQLMALRAQTSPISISCRVEQKYVLSTTAANKKTKNKTKKRTLEKNTEISTEDLPGTTDPQNPE
jgi:hypothetical protein